MSNYEPSVLKKLKSDYAALRQFNPWIIPAILTGYGRKGRDKDQRGFDFGAAWAHTGMMHLVGESGRPPPSQRGGVGDRTAEAYITAGILAPLVHRDKTENGITAGHEAHQGCFSLSQFHRNW